MVHRVMKFSSCDIKEKENGLTKDSLFWEGLYSDNINESIDELIVLNV